MRKDDDRDPTQSLWSDACRKAGAVGEFLQETFNLARESFDSLRSRPGVSLSLVCPQLGCLMHWNDAENTWDCPCHGSRFDARGRLICGPVNQDLEPAREAAERRRRAPAPVAEAAQERRNAHDSHQRRETMNAKRLIDPRLTAMLALTAALLAFPARPAPAQEDPRPEPAQQESQSAPEPNRPEQAEATTGDAEIMAQVIAIDENEIQLARSAQKKNATGTIQRYAKMIEQDHTRDREMLRALADTLGLTLTTTTTVDQLHARGQEAVSRLAPLTGEQFGRGFMVEMVNGHREALQMIDDFLKAAQNEELKQHLKEARGKIAMHLAEGEKILSSLGRTDRPAPSSSGTRPDPPLLA